MSTLPESLHLEIEHNLECLKSDLASITNGQDSNRSFTEEYRFDQFTLYKSRISQPPEFLEAFYRSLRILSAGHPGLIAADEADLEKGFRITIEAAIRMGEEMLGEKS